MCSRQLCAVHSSTHRAHNGTVCVPVIQCHHCLVLGAGDYNTTFLYNSSSHHHHPDAEQWPGTDQHNTNFITLSFSISIMNRRITCTFTPRYLTQHTMCVQVCMQIWLWSWLWLVCSESISSAGVQPVPSSIIWVYSLLRNFPFYITATSSSFSFSTNTLPPSWLQVAAVPEALSPSFLMQDTKFLNEISWVYIILTNLVKIDE